MTRQELEAYATDLRTWLSNPARKQTNPQGWADRERELEWVEEKLGRPE